MDNSSVIALTKNPVFKHFDTIFHYPRDFITDKEVEVKYIKIQYQVTNTFTKPLKYDVLTKIRDLLGVLKKSSLRGMLKIKLDFWFFWRIEESIHRLID